MIREYYKSEIFKILDLINDAALKYKGIIPYDCFQQPYISEKKLTEEFNNGVRMYGYHDNKTLVAVIGVQEVKDVTLIRHAYTLSLHQGKGFGSSLLKYLIEKNNNSRLLVGTWRDAIWAIRFYKKFSFIVHTKEETNLLLKKYWNIPAKQIENSIVMERY